MPAFAWTSDRVGRVLGVSETGARPREYTGVSTDSRTVEPGQLFVALPGDRFDGADFVADAARAGAVGTVVEREPEGDLPEDFEVFPVEDALAALGALARERRCVLDPTVVAVTGTSGKTSTRELIAAALGSGCFASPGNYNNLIGVPLSMLMAPESATLWVLELASNAPGEIDALGRTAEPDHGVITSVSEGHLEGLGDVAGVLDEKLALVPTLRAGAFVVVNSEPPELAERARALDRRVVTVGLDPAADEHPEAWDMDADGVSGRWRGADFFVPAVGRHMLQNALMALVVARELGVEPSEAAPRLGDVQPPAMRGTVRQIGSLTLLVDCYNANPASFRAALDALQVLAGDRRRAALVGTMLELGAHSDRLHRRVAEWLLESEIDVIAAVGAFREALERAAGTCTVRLILEDDAEVAYRRLAESLRGDEVVLLKASRGMRFDELIPAFEREFDDSGREDS